MMRLSRCDLCHIDLDQVSVRRGGQLLLQDVSMHIHCGQLTVLIGQNGAGKTTLIRALLGEISHGGSIRHLDSSGRDLAHLTTGYVPQHLSFDPEMPLTVMDFLASAMTRRPVWTGVSAKVRSQVIQALQDVSAGDLADRPLGRCSGGELQRVLLALALHPAPDLLVLDEPVSGVDRNGLKLFLDTVTRLKEKKHIAILLVSHDLRLVREYADYVILLDKNVLAQGTPREVFSSPAFDMVFGAGAEAESRENAEILPPQVISPRKESKMNHTEVSASRIIRLTSHRHEVFEEGAENDDDAPAAERQAEKEADTVSVREAEGSAGSSSENDASKQKTAFSKEGKA